MVAPATGVLRNKRRVHISTSCENCSTGLPEEEEMRHINKLYESGYREPTCGNSRCGRCGILSQRARKSWIVGRSDFTSDS
ncbi:hypothetical protein BDV59DRAFT_188918 [Aspergillus ambiguus]|uniref:uncharacterized protein n=1 Tax=Aspergillus ambiguus TaxID=176160 RepID=UPI003CCCF8B9